MTSKSVSNSFVLDMGEFVNEIYQQVLRYEEKSSSRLMRDCGDLVFKMVDDYINAQLFWARARKPSADSHDLRSYEFYGTRKRTADKFYRVTRNTIRDFAEEFHRLLRKIPNALELLEVISDKLTLYILDYMDLPTWRIVYIRRSNNSVFVEVGEDYRIDEWMKAHAHEYGFRVD